MTLLETRSLGPPVVPRLLAVPALLALALGGCDDDDSSFSAEPARLRIDSDYGLESRTDVYTWGTAATVARMDLRVDDFHHGTVRIKVLDAAGMAVLAARYGLHDDVFIFGEDDFRDVRFTEPGVSGAWTVILEYDDFTGDLTLILDDTMSSAPVAPGQ